MAVFFVNMKTFGRSDGSTATSAIAYRSGERIRDERTGKTFDHSHRQDVLHKEIVIPAKLADADMSWARERAALWNAVEASETRKNARVAREYLVSLPAELSREQQVGLTRGFSQELADRHGFVVDFAVHAPRNDPRNFHAHLLVSTREIHTTGFGAKTGMELSDRDRQLRGLEPFFKEVVHTRERWAAMTNEALAAAQSPVRVDHRSLEAQGIDREPQPTLPRAVYEMERRGERTVVGERLREEFRARVAARLENSTAQSSAAAPVTAESRPVPQSLDEIRRQAREEWLRMRQSANSSASAEPARGRGLNEDLSR